MSAYFEGRNVEELDGALGPIGSFVPVPARFDGDLRFDEVLDAVEKAAAEAEQRLEYYSAPAAQILPIGFSYEESELEERYGGVTFRIEEAEAGGEPYTLKLAAKRQGERLILRFEYDAAKLSAAAVQRFSEAVSHPA